MNDKKYSQDEVDQMNLEAAAQAIKGNKTGNIATIIAIFLAVSASKGVDIVSDNRLVVTLQANVVAIQKAVESNSSSIQKVVESIDKTQKENNELTTAIRINDARQDRDIAYIKSVIE